MDDRLSSVDMYSTTCEYKYAYSLRVTPLADCYIGMILIFVAP